MTDSFTHPSTNTTFYSLSFLTPEQRTKFLERCPDGTKVSVKHLFVGSWVEKRGKEFVLCISGSKHTSKSLTLPDLDYHYVELRPHLGYLPGEYFELGDLNTRQRMIGELCDGTVAYLPMFIEGALFIAMNRTLEMCGVEPKAQVATYNSKDVQIPQRKKGESAAEFGSRIHKQFEAYMEAPVPYVPTAPKPKASYGFYATVPDVDRIFRENPGSNVVTINGEVWAHARVDAYLSEFFDLEDDEQSAPGKTLEGHVHLVDCTVEEVLEALAQREHFRVEAY